LIKARGDADPLRDFVDAAGVYALGADEDAPDLTGDARAHPLQIGSPGSFGFVVGVTDVVPHRAAFAANLAVSCHD
jgi:hypothetical protein